MKYIFPRQFGLHNVFTSKTNTKETIQPFHDYTLREKEIAQLNENSRRRQPPKNGLDRALPKRLRGGCFRLVQKLQKLHTRCAYSELLAYYCPPPVRSRGSLALVVGY